MACSVLKVYRAEEFFEYLNVKIHARTYAHNINNDVKLWHFKRLSRFGAPQVIEYAKSTRASKMTRLLVVTTLRSLHLPWPFLPKFVRSSIGNKFIKMLQQEPKLPHG